MLAQIRLPVKAVTTMSRRSTLESQLASISSEFVTRIVTAIRGASLSDVVAFSSKNGNGQAILEATTARLKSSSGGRRPRQTADRRAELADRIVRTLATSGEPLGARAVASELGVPADLLAAPLRELRAAHRIRKYGEKRNATYAATGK